MVDERPGRIDECQGYAAHRQQSLDHRMRQRDRASGTAEFGCGQHLVAAGPRVDVPGAELVKSRAGSRTRCVVGLRAQGETDAPERVQPRPGRLAKGDHVSRKRGAHQRPPSTERATSMRCTSIVPEATVAACA